MLGKYRKTLGKYRKTLRKYGNWCSKLALETGARNQRSKLPLETGARNWRSKLALETDAREKRSKKALINFRIPRHMWLSVSRSPFRSFHSLFFQLLCSLPNLLSPIHHMWHFSLSLLSLIYLYTYDMNNDVIHTSIIKYRQLRFNYCPIFEWVYVWCNDHRNIVVV